MKPIRTMEEFSEHVGLSRPTVSRYFDDPGSVRASTRERIEGAIAASGYRPNLLAVNLNRRRSRILGVVVPTLLDPFYMAVARRIDRTVAAHGFQAFTLCSDGSPERELEAIGTFASMNVAGTLIAPLGRETVRSKLRAAKRDMPLVALDSPLDERTAFVGTDNAQSVSLMVDYLCRSGEPPVYFDMPDINDNAPRRREAYVEAMEGFGHAPRFAFEAGTASATWDFESFARERTRTILAAGGFASRTVLCANDRLAFGVLSACFGAGLHVVNGPDDDLRVAGHDDQPLSAFTCPPLTTVAQGHDDIGRIAVEILLSKIGATEPPPELVGNRALLEGRLVMRASA